MAPDSVGMPLQVRVEADVADSPDAKAIWHTHARNAISKCIDRLEDRWDT